MYQEPLRKKMDNYGYGPEELASLTWTSVETVYKWLEEGMTGPEYVMVCRILEMKANMNEMEYRIHTYEKMIIGEE